MQFLLKNKKILLTVLGAAVGALGYFGVNWQPVKDIVCSPYTGPVMPTNVASEATPDGGADLQE